MMACAWACLEESRKPACACVCAPHDVTLCGVCADAEGGGRVFFNQPKSQRHGRSVCVHSAGVECVCAVAWVVASFRRGESVCGCACVRFFDCE